MLWNLNGISFTFMQPQEMLMPVQATKPVDIVGALEFSWEFFCPSPLEELTISTGDIKGDFY